MRTKGYEEQLGFVEAIAGVTAGVLALGVQGFSTFAQLDLQEEQLELQNAIEQRKLDMQQQVIDAQTRMISVQTDGLKESQQINNQLLGAEVELKNLQVDRQRAVNQALVELDKVEIEAKKQVTKTQADALKSQLNVEIAKSKIEIAEQVKDLNKEKFSIGKFVGENAPLIIGGVIVLGISIFGRE